MNILFLSHFYFPHIGGVERHIEKLSEQLLKKGHRIKIVTERISNTKKTEIINNTEIIRISYPKIRFVGLFVIWFWFLKNLSLIKQSNIIHCHDVFIWYLPIRFLFPKKPVYLTFHGYENENPSRKVIFLHKLSEKLTRGNICIGDFHKKWFGIKPNFVSYGAIEQVEDSKLKADGRSIIFLGRLEKDTGILTYLKVLSILKKKNIPFSLDIFGDGSLRKECECFVNEENLNCRFHGFVKNASREIPRFQFAFVSQYLAILESFARKKLVFATFRSELKKDYLEMAPFAGWMMIEKDPLRMAEKISFSLSHPEKEKELISKAYNWVKQETWDNLTEIYLKLWQQK